MSETAAQWFERFDKNQVVLALLVVGAFFIGMDWGRRSALTTLKEKFKEAKDARPTSPPAGDTVA